MDLPLFVSHSMSAFYIDLLGPVHWLSEWQTVTAGSSAAAEIYATDECVKFLLELVTWANLKLIHEIEALGKLWLVLSYLRLCKLCKKVWPRKKVRDNSLHVSYGWSSNFQHSLKWLEKSRWSCTHFFLNCKVMCFIKSFHRITKFPMFCLWV